MYWELIFSLGKIYKKIQKNLHIYNWWARTQAHQKMDVIACDLYIIDHLNVTLNARKQITDKVISIDKIKVQAFIRTIYTQPEWMMFQ